MALRLALLGSVLAYLATLPTPPTLWTWGEWMHHLTVAFGLLAAKLASSPLKHSDEVNVAQRMSERP